MFMNYRWSDEKPYSLKYSIQFYTHTYINLLIAKLCSVVSCMKVNFYPEAEILLPRERGPPKNFPCVLLNVTPLKHIVPRTNLKNLFKILTFWILMNIIVVFQNLELDAIKKLGFVLDLNTVLAPNRGRRYLTKNIFWFLRLPLKKCF